MAVDAGAVVLERGELVVGQLEPAVGAALTVEAAAEGDRVGVGKLDQGEELAVLAVVGGGEPSTSRHLQRSANGVKLTVLS